MLEQKSIIKSENYISNVRKEIYSREEAKISPQEIAIINGIYAQAKELKEFVNFINRVQNGK